MARSSGGSVPPPVFNVAAPDLSGLERQLELEKQTGASAQDRLNRILADLEEIQNRVAELSDELDSDTLEEAEGDLDIVIDRIISVIEEYGWEVK